MNVKQIVSGTTLAVILGISGPALADRIDNPADFGVEYTGNASQSIEAGLSVNPEALDPATYAVEQSEESAEAIILQDLSGRV